MIVVFGSSRTNLKFYHVLHMFFATHESWSRVFLHKKLSIAPGSRTGSISIYSVNYEFLGLLFPWLQKGGKIPSYDHLYRDLIPSLFISS